MIANRDSRLRGWGAAGSTLFVAMNAASTASGGATNFTTLNSGAVTLSSFNGTPITPSATATYTGPSNNLPFWSSLTNIGTPGAYGTAEWGNEGLGASTDWFASQYTSADPNSTFTIEMSWNVTFSQRVELSALFLNPSQGFGTLTYTPTGGGASTLAIGTQLAAGTYDIVWNYNETTPRSGGSQGFYFDLVANPVPGSGVAAVASLGLAALGRRRRR